MSLARLESLAREAGLFVSGTCAADPVDGLPERFRSIALLSPDEPRFWDIVTASPEWADGGVDPLDRWSRRVVAGIACALGGKALFPFGGPPYLPFLGWALRTGRCHSSPVHLLVHDVAGLFISFRGAVALAEELPSDPRPAPCESCETRPCLNACPVGALTAAGYDLPACHRWLEGLAGQPEGGDCRAGCLVRRACPVGQGRRRPEQSAHHMRHFHR